MIRDAIDLVRTELADAIVERAVAVLTSPAAPLFGAAILLAIGRWLGWWLVASIAVAGIGDTAIAAAQLLLGRR